MKRSCPPLSFTAFKFNLSSLLVAQIELHARLASNDGPTSLTLRSSSKMGTVASSIPPLPDLSFPADL